MTDRHDLDALRPSEQQRASRRDAAVHRRRHGMRIDGAGVRRIASDLARRPYTPADLVADLGALAPGFRAVSLPNGSVHLEPR